MHLSQAAKSVVGTSRTRPNARRESAMRCKADISHGCRPGRPAQISRRLEPCGECRTFMAASILRWISLRAALSRIEQDLGCLFVAKFIDQAFLTPTFHAARFRFAC
jgi:hypothetical protein